MQELSRFMFECSPTYVWKAKNVYGGKHQIDSSSVGFIK